MESSSKYSFLSGFFWSTFICEIQNCVRPLSVYFYYCVILSLHIYRTIYPFAGCKILSRQFILFQLLKNGIQLTSGFHHFCWADSCQLIVAYSKVIFLYSLVAFKIFLVLFVCLFSEVYRWLTIDVNFFGISLAWGSDPFWNVWTDGLHQF